MCGNAEIRNRAAPIGISVISSTGSAVCTGYGGNTAVRSYWSIIHSGTFFPLAFISIGTSSIV